MRANTATDELVPTDGAATSPYHRPVGVGVVAWRGGRPGRGTIRTRLPQFIASRSFFRAGTRLPHDDASLAAGLTVIERCAPWVHVYAGPRLWALAQDDTDLSAFRIIEQMPDGGWCYEIGGQAWHVECVPDGHPEVILLSTCKSMSGMLATVHHEVWHVVEHYLSPQARAVIDDAVSNGLPLPGEYLDSAIERRARLYESWSCAIDEGQRVAVPVNAVTVDSIFWHVYSGQLACELAAPHIRKPGLIERIRRVLEGR